MSKPAIYLDLKGEHPELKRFLLEAISKYLKDVYSIAKYSNISSPAVVDVPKTLSRTNCIDVLVADYAQMEENYELARKFQDLEKSVKQLKKVWEE